MVRFRVLVYFVVFSFLFVFSCFHREREKRSFIDEILWEKDQKKKIELIEIFFKNIVEKGGKDEIINLVEYASLLQRNGQFDKSSKFFIKSDKLSSQLDFTSISEEVSSVILNENLKKAKLSTYESIMINLLNVLNFLALNDLEKALVESRKVDLKTKFFRDRIRKDFEFNPCASYFAGLAFEASSDYANARVMYEKALKQGYQSFEFDKEILRVSYLAHQHIPSRYRVNDLSRTYDLCPFGQRKNCVELVFIIIHGLAPRKEFAEGSPELPKLVPRRIPEQRFTLSLDQHVIPFHIACDLEDYSVRNLEKDYASLAARRMVGKVGKFAIANEIEKRSQGLGVLAYLMLDLTDQADLRTWVSAPQTIQILRVSVPQKDMITFRLTSLSEMGVKISDFLEGSIDLAQLKKSKYNIVVHSVP